MDRRAEFLAEKWVEITHCQGLFVSASAMPQTERPESVDILQHINTALSQVPAPAETVFQQLEGLRSENQRQGTEIQRQGTEILRLGNEVTMNVIVLI